MIGGFVIIIAGGDRGFGSSNGHLTQFLSIGQFLQPAQAEVFEKHLGGAVGLRPAGAIGAPDHFGQLALHQRPDHTVHGDAADFLHLRAGNGLAIGDDGQGFKSRLGEARGAVLDADQGAYPRSVLRLSDKLPGTGHAHEAMAAVKRVHFLGKSFQCLGDGSGLGLGKFLGLALAHFASLFQDVLQLFCAQGFLGGEKNRLENVLQFHG